MQGAKRTNRKSYNEADELRRRAIEAYGPEPKDDAAKSHPFGCSPGAPTGDGAVPAKKLRRELELHAIELELQNEDLRHSRVELERGLARYAQVFDFAPIGYACLSGVGNVIDVNLAGAELLGRVRRRIKGACFSSFLCLADRVPFHDFIRNALARGGRSTCTLQLKRPTGATLVVLCTASIVPDAEPTILLAFQDMSAEKRAEEKLQRASEALRVADRRKNDFLALLSHELRTPLSTLLIHGQILQLPGIDSSKANRSGQFVERAARAQARLVEDLIDVSRIVAGKLTMKFDQVNLAAIMRIVVDAAEKEASRKGVRLVARWVDEGLPMTGDSTRLQQAISNVLFNAIKFTPEGGAIPVSLHSTGGTARIEVTDTGMGIDPEFLPHVFERFSQADTSSTRAAAGLGLGLSIAHAIVEAHRGTLRAASDGRDKGSKFTFEMPIVSKALAPAERRQESRRQGSTMTGARLLVVDDDKDTRSTFSQILANAGADVREADCAEAALAMLDEFSPDVIVCDLAMPREDGYSLLRRIRSRGPTRGGKVPALALTAHADTGARTRTRKAGFENHLIKPVGVRQLIEAVSNLLLREGVESGESLETNEAIAAPRPRADRETATDPG